MVSCRGRQSVFPIQLGLEHAISGSSGQVRPAASLVLPAAPPPEPPSLEKFHADNIKNLSGICRRVLDGAQEIVSYVDGNREDARLAGIEALAAEISGILEGGRLQDLQDHLDYALARNKGADLTLENLSRLNRVERLLSESTRALAFFVSPPTSPYLGAAGAAAPAKEGIETLLIIALAASAVVAIVLLGTRNS